MGDSVRRWVSRTDGDFDAKGLGPRIAVGEQFQVVDSDIRSDDERHVLPDPAEMGSEDGEEALRIMADAFIDAQRQFDGSIGRSLAHLRGDIAFERSPSAEMLADRLTIAEYIGFGRGRFEANNSALVVLEDHVLGQLDSIPADSVKVGPFVRLEAGWDSDGFPRLLAIATKLPITIERCDCANGSVLGVSKVRIQREDDEQDDERDQGQPSGRQGARSRLALVRRNDSERESSRMCGGWPVVVCIRGHGADPCNSTRQGGAVAWGLGGHPLMEDRSHPGGTDGSERFGRSLSRHRETHHTFLSQESCIANMSA